MVRCIGCVIKKKEEEERHRHREGERRERETKKSHPRGYNLLAFIVIMHIGQSGPSGPRQGRGAQPFTGE